MAPRVLVTRAPLQASALAEALRGRGLEAVLIPAIEIAALESFTALDGALDGVGGFDWVVFTSANAVEVCAGRGFRAGALGGCRVAAIGAATVRALEAVGVTVEVVPERSVAEALVEALLPSAKAGVRFLLVRADVGRAVLPEALRAAGAQVDVVPAYRNVIPAGSMESVRAMFASEATWPDAVTFTSGSAATNLFALMEAAGVVLPERVLRVSIGPVTSAVMRGLGWEVSAEAREATVAALAEAVVGALQTRS